MINNEYLLDYNVERFKIAYSFQSKKKKELNITSYNNAYLLPGIKNTSNKLFGNGGVVSEDGSFCRESAIYSRAGVINEENCDDDIECYFGGKYPYERDGVVQFQETVVYLGYINNHWGHFLVDFSTRLWFALAHKNDCYSYVFVTDYKKDLVLIPQIKRFFQILGILDHIKIINEVIQYDKIIIPQAGYVTNSYFSQQYIDVFTYISNEIMRLSYNKDLIEKYNDKLIYYTRSNYKRAVTCELGEKSIKICLENNGFLSISPETLSLDEQVIILKSAKRVVATSGTLTHNLLFCNNNYTTDYVMLNKTYVINMVQVDLNKLLELNVTYVDSHISKYPVTIGKGPFLYHITDQYIKWAKDCGYFVKSESKYQTKKKLCMYEKMFRRLFATYNYNFSVSENWNTVNFYTNKIYLSYLKDYYLTEHPISISEKRVGKIQLLLSLVIIKIKNKCSKLKNNKS